MNPAQQPLFHIPSQPLEVYLFHDVSGSYGQDQWIVWGYLFYKRSSESNLLTFLRESRAAEECWSPLHFADLPGGWGGEGKHKPRTAFRWLEGIQAHFKSDLWFQAFGLDTKDSGFDRSQFPRKFHLNNRFCRMGLTSAIPWFFKGIDTLSIESIFHRQTFEGETLAGIGAPGEDYDNLGRYIVSEISKDSTNRHRSQPTLWPKVRFKGPVKFLSINPKDESDADHPKCEFLQLTDIILGAIRQAIDGNSHRKTKRELASIVGQWAADVRQKPWVQEFGLHRRFSVSYFPGPSGKAYSDGPLRLSARLPGTRQSRFRI